MTHLRLCCPSAPLPHSHLYLSATHTSDTSNIYSMLPFSFCISSSMGFHLISTFYHTILCTLCQLIFGQNKI
ncbi:hypothetical protein B0H10DRAFT_1979750, partial [Mycena sp. CBHHK59/15]